MAINLTVAQRSGHCVLMRFDHPPGAMTQWRLNPAL
ncbi:hypothetical protein SAMN05660463_03231 [Pseudomonas sp. URIL14HWK12:I9]|nr:hypothetical protein F474_03779 [Pseudomonas sp. URIL14HWK12:I12]PVZ22449.1 hypothetical protein F470_03779 [Pseudomonas sp. URIL14HWK12:I10]PVZ31427.1 hypothetical protein F472_03592 [Pseudomonas sp. URIL14HWK12:I11]SNZ16247.1 hypothetical protein SAMN05660463_03231 [Pseudomonas sp. URIL14HWK12:I9]